MVQTVAETFLQRERTDRDGQAGRAADDLFRVLADMITSGGLVAGDPLPTERAIVQEYGVSRTVVREAVLALANSGFVEARPRCRPIVRKPSYDTAFETVDTVVGRLLREPNGVRNLFDTRIMLEAGLVREAAIHALKQDIADMKEVLGLNERAINDSNEFYRTDMAFHALLYDIPGNPVLSAAQKAYMTWLAPHWAKMPRLPERNARNFADHQAIYEAILMRDPDAAEAALRAHLKRAWTQVRETFGNI